MNSGSLWHSSGIHWRSGIIVTAEEVLERDDNIKLTLPGGRVADASLAGRDPTTDVAVLRFQPDGLPVATTADARLRVGQVVLAMGNHDGEPLAAFGIVALAGGAWHSIRGGTIDSLIRLDLALSPAAEGGALVDLQGRVIGMTVLGPRRRALSIPTSTIDRAVDQLLARGGVFRGYLGAGLQPMKQERASNESQASGNQRGVLVVRIDPVSGKVITTVDLDTVPGDLAVGLGSVWVATGGLTRIDPVSRRIVGRLDLGTDCGNLIVAGGSVWSAADGQPYVDRISPQ